VIGSAPALAEAKDVVGPWWLLSYDDSRTPILSFDSPVSRRREVTGPSTDVHLEYFRVQPGAPGAPSAQSFFRYALMDLLALASSATPVDNEFWSVVFPSPPGRQSFGALNLTYVTQRRWGLQLPELSSFALPDDAPPLQLVFSARHALVPASLPYWGREGHDSLPVPLPRISQVSSNALAIPRTSATLPLALPAPRRDFTHIAAYQRLRDALPLADEELAEVLGVGRTTPYKWSREGSAPKAKTLRIILQLDAIVRGLIASRGRADFDEWLVLGDPTPVQLLREHSIDLFERRAHAAIFTPIPGRAIGYETEAPPLSQRQVAVPALAPRRVKVSLTKRDR